MYHRGSLSGWIGNIGGTRVQVQTYLSILGRTIRHGHSVTRGLRTARTVDSVWHRGGDRTSLRIK